MREPSRILIVDDSEDDRLLYRRCLKLAAAKYTVVEASTGEDALARPDLESLACVLLDYSLPGRASKSSNASGSSSPFCRS